MTKQVKAQICWIPPKDGGRQKPPLGPSYSTIVRFDNDTSDWFKEAWSIVAECLGPPDESLCIMADLRFLVDDAPTHLLSPGNSFKLFEGLKLVATGKIIENK